MFWAKHTERVSHGFLIYGSAVTQPLGVHPPRINCQLSLHQLVRFGRCSLWSEATVNANTPCCPTNGLLPRTASREPGVIYNWPCHGSIAPPFCAELKSSYLALGPGWCGSTGWLLSVVGRAVPTLAPHWRDCWTEPETLAEFDKLPKVLPSSMRDAQLREPREADAAPCWLFTCMNLYELNPKCYYSFIHPLFDYHKCEQTANSISLWK